MIVDTENKIYCEFQEGIPMQYGRSSTNGWIVNKHYENGVTFRDKTYLKTALQAFCIELLVFLGRFTSFLKRL